MTCFTIDGWIEVHHRDENRQNNKLENLIILCRSCHKKNTILSAIRMEGIYFFLARSLPSSAYLVIAFCP